MDINSIFDGIGTEIISCIIGLLFGGAGGIGIGYKIAINKNKQKQKARDNANQTQIGSITNINGKE